MAGRGELGGSSGSGYRSRPRPYRPGRVSSARGVTVRGSDRREEIDKGDGDPYGATRRRGEQRRRASENESLQHAGRPSSERRRDRGREEEYEEGAKTGFAYLSHKVIDDLACSPASDIIRCVADNEIAFVSAYTHPPNCTNRPVLKHLIKILYVLVESKDETYTPPILAQILSRQEPFVSQLNIFIACMPIETNEPMRSVNVKYLQYLICIGIFVIEQIPNSVEVFPYELMCGVSEFPLLKPRMVALQPKMQMMKQKLIHLKLLSTVEQQQSQDPEPPESFRDVQVLPQPVELNPGSQKPFLRANITAGSYKNWDHYLDVQYRLLREDFLGPLREGICSLQEGEKSTDINVYQRARILEPVCTPAGVGFQLQFDTTHLKKVKWEHSKRLIYGSLLCLSDDNFKTMIFATVFKHEPKLLAKGIISIVLEGQCYKQLNFATEYVIAESSAYFEAYRHVLECLKQINPSLMPFGDYIVASMAENVPPPRYLRTGNKHIDLKPILKRKSPIQISVTDLKTWPSFRDTSLDESQLNALQLALSQEVSLIQGPPGTGKTFIGLKIVETLLLNRTIFDPNRLSPILVLCYTNHALDQFLELVHGLKATKVARVGGRSKSPLLADCTLANLLAEYDEQKQFPSGLQRRWAKIKRQRYTQMDEINSLLINDGPIIELEVLKDLILPMHYTQLCDAFKFGNKISMWLGLCSIPAADHKNGDEDHEAGAVSKLNESIHEEPSIYSDDGDNDDDDDDDDGDNDDDDCDDDDGDDDDDDDHGDHGDDDGDDDDDDDDQLVDVDQEASLIEDDRISEPEDCTDQKPKNHRKSIEQIVKQSFKPSFHNDASEWISVQMSDRSRRRKIKNGISNCPMKEQEANAVKSVLLLNNKQRWMLYRYWVQRFQHERFCNVSSHTNSYEATCKQYTSIQDERSLHILRSMDVVGMTTTGASKHHSLVRDISPRIVIVEEAAEVFEAHVITALSPSVQQLVMIGDHKQLRPKPSNYDLERNFNFNVSLFERLINNEMPFVTLTSQHRMRPEIAHLICPHIYDRIENSENVLKYEHINGVGKDIFFIDHRQLELHRSGEDMYSHVNTYEAKYMVALCHHLLKQGYKPNQITMLTMYRGQLLEIKRGMKKAVFEGVRVAVVDDFQGEENDIILLSLVRSNLRKDIGFLKASNRICVSLSRAKKGFYAIGNLSMFRGNDGTVWVNILLDMEKRHCIGRALPLYCQNHPAYKVLIKTPEDFSIKFPKGGCLEKCTARLKCGHKCPLSCHPYDQEHVASKCGKKCPKQLPCGHQCEQKCYQCVKGCRPCSKKVHKDMTCGHTILLPCQEDPNEASCVELCNKKLPCGHLCKLKCSEPCSKLCQVLIKKKLPCGHTANAKCSEHPLEVNCNAPCLSKLLCDHKCRGTCGQCRNGRLHIRCTSKCGRLLPCGHICDFPCASNCPPCNKQCANHCNHSQCSKKCHEPCDPCTEDCPWQCEHFKCTKRCGDLCNRPPCNEPCTMTLRCGHPCIGLCGEFCPILCRVCNKDEVIAIFFGSETEEDARFIQLQDCKHILEVKGLDKWFNESEGEVQFKSCPKCKRVIRRHLRYGNVVKQSLIDMESIKRKQLVNVDRLLNEVEKTAKKVSDSKNNDCVKAIIEQLQTLLSARKQLTQQYTHTVQIYILIVPEVVRLLDVLDLVACELSYDTFVVSLPHLKEDIMYLLKIIAEAQFVFCDQQLHDILTELRRIKCTVELCDIKYKLTTLSHALKAADKQSLSSLTCRILESGKGKSPKVTKDEEAQVARLIASLSTLYNLGPATESERIEIVKAMGASDGHWFKCPKGHYYYIAGCGGAMVTGKCPDCGNKVGGRLYTLAKGNERAANSML